MHTRNVVMNRNEARVLSIPMKERAKVTEKSLSFAKYPSNLGSSTYFPQKARANKPIKQQENLHGV